MTVFYITLVSTFLMGILVKITDIKNIKIASLFWISLIGIILIMVAGLRNNIGDTYYYMHSYSLLASGEIEFELGKDFGFSLLNLILLQISTNPQILIFATALITNLLNTVVFYKYRSYIELQIYIYITSGYYLTTMNGIRQCLAAAFLFLATNLLIEGKFKTYLILVLIVSTMHASALVMIPVYFIVRKEAWSKTTFMMILFCIVGVLFANIFMEILFKLLEGTQYDHYQEFNEGGSSFIRTIVNAVPVILAYIKRKELKEKWPESDIFVNLAVINLVFVALGMVNWIFNRFTLYFQLYNFILLPYIIKNCFRGSEKKLIYFGFIICYFIFFYKEQIMYGTVKYSSDYLEFNKIFYSAN